MDCQRTYAANQTSESRFTLKYQKFYSTEAGDNNLLSPSIKQVGIVTKSHDPSCKDIFFKQLSEASIGSHGRRFLGYSSYCDIGSVLISISFPTNDYYLVYFGK